MGDDQKYYHDFSCLGVETTPLTEQHRLNQEAKTDILLPMIQDAIELSDYGTGLEMFCADGFYSHFAVINGAKHMYGVDLGDEKSFGSKAYLESAKSLGYILATSNRTKFEDLDVFAVTGMYDMTLCLGGLYHMRDPEYLLAKVKSVTRKVAVFQTVYNPLVRELFFEEAPDIRPWGSQFSLNWIIKEIIEAGFDVQKIQTNKLRGNDRPWDTGSVYVLCTV